jgi:Domain of unknown function (DUF4203)
MISHQPLVVVALVVLGLAEVFLGYRLFRILVGVLGALVGFFYAPDIIALVTGEAPAFAVAVVVGAALALAFALLAWYVFWLAVFAWGAAVGYAAAMAAFDTLPWLAVVIGIVVGMLAMLFQRVLIVLLTALNGAWLVVAGIAFLLGHITSAPRGLAFDPLLEFHQPIAIWLLGITLVLAAIGAVFQFRDTTPMLGHTR